ncbi:annexin A6-like [Lineus longissimus]|uniref:annexin A6-like n=1 Tax=Lineus longissimus TaxID=88925 RepID=UPI00315DC0C6
MADVGEKCQGTVVPRKDFGDAQAAQAAAVFRKAMKGLGTNEAHIIDILASHTNQQLQAIWMAYKKANGRDLLADIRGDLSGDFLKLAEALLKERKQYDAESLKAAMEGLGTDEDTLIEIVCTRSNKELMDIKTKYHSLYYANLEDNISSDTHGNFTKVLNGICAATRDEGTTVDKEQCKRDAQALYDAGEKKLGTDESVFNRLFVTKNVHHLRQVFDFYKEIAGKDITESIDSETSGDYRDVLQNLVRIVRNRPEYFADKLHKSMKGVGTNDTALIRLVVTRCEVDMVLIMEQFQKKYGKSLSDWIRDDTSGDYRRVLLRLVGLTPEEIDPKKPVTYLLDRLPVCAIKKKTAKMPKFQAIKIRASGTVCPNPHFNPEDAAAKLRKAMKGLGTDEDAIIDVLAAHDNAQRREIAKKFQVMYGKDLVDNIKSEVSGNFKDLCTALLKEPLMYEVELVHDAMAGLGTDERDLIDIICTKNNHEIKTLKDKYKEKYRKNIEDDIKGDTSGYFRRVLIALLAASRDEGCSVNKAQVKGDAEDFHKAGKGLGTDEVKYNQILCSRSFNHLREMFDEYKRLTGKDIEHSIKSETSGDYEDSLLAVVKCIKNKPRYFAERLAKSMEGLGTKDNDLIRVMVCRSEIDLADIRAEFYQLKKKNLEDWIKGDCSGDYKKLLLKILGTPC